MNACQHLRLMFSLSLLLLSFDLFATTSDPLNLNNEDCNKPRKSFEVAWPVPLKKLSNKVIDNPMISSVKLKSSDGDAFEVDYAVAFMSKTIKLLTETNAVGNNINLSEVSSKICMKVIEYCKKHSEASKFKEQRNDMMSSFKYWDADLVEVDEATLFDLFLTVNTLNIKGLLDLTTQKIAEMMKGKTTEEIRKAFNIKEEKKGQVHEEKQWASEKCPKLFSY